MKILLLTAYFPPDTGSAAHLFYELGTELVSHGHQVTVITNKPGYHAQGSLEQYQKKFIVRETINDMRVLRVPSLRLPPQLMVGRALWQFSMAFMFWLAGLILPPHDVVLVYSPPLTLGLAAWGIRLLRRTPFVTNIQDLFPKSIIDLGLLRNPAFIRFFEGLERLIYRTSDCITVHSEGNQEYVVASGGQDVQVEVFHNWVDTTFIQPGNRMNTFRQSHDLGDSFVVSFAGVLGYSQDVDVILDAANRLDSRLNITWVIVGDGVEKSRLLLKAERMGLKKVRFIPMQPREKYPAVLHASDVGLAALHKSVKTPVVPSKILSIMAAGRPVIAVMNPDGDAPKLIEQAKCGFALPSDDSRALADAVMRLHNDRGLCRQMGENGRRYAEEHLSLSATVGKYENLFETISNVITSGM